MELSPDKGKSPRDWMATRWTRGNEAKVAASRIKTLAASPLASHCITRERSFRPARLAITLFPMVMLRAFIVLAALLATMVAPLRSAPLPNYKLGDVASEDVITPVPLLVVNPEATEALKQKVASQVHFILRHTPHTAGEVEAELRASLAQTRTSFMAALQAVLDGRVPRPTDLDTPLFATTVREFSRGAPKDFPLQKLAALWVRGLGDDAGLQELWQPLREVMGQPIVGSRTDNPLPATVPVRILPVKSATEPPTAAELENGGDILPSARVLSLWRARRLVETHFATGSEDLGRFAAGFVRPNAFPDAALTEVARAQRMDGVTVNDTYEAAQVIVRKGQTIDRKALSALAVVREKSMIGTLQNQLQQEQSVAGLIDRQTQWIAAGLGVMVVGVLVILWRLRARPSTAVVPLPAGFSLPYSEPRALAGGEGREWRDRALVAEQKVERTHQAIRSGVLGWMREKIMQTLFRHRAELLSSQQKAEAEMRELEHRLEQLHTPLQDRISAYEERIEQLERDLAAKGEENRELIGARISVVRQQLRVERERGRFGIN